MFQWSPDRASVFGSSAEDGFLNVWDHEKVTNHALNHFVPSDNPAQWFVKAEEWWDSVPLLFSHVLFSPEYSFFLLRWQVGKKKNSNVPAGLFFQHAGHRYDAVGGKAPWTNRDLRSLKGTSRIWDKISASVDHYSIWVAICPQTFFTALTDGGWCI